MLLQTLTVIPDGVVGPFLAMLAFGAYHGLNPGMGWLFALSLGLQRQSERAIWISLLPIAAGHAASLALVAVLVVAGARFVSTTTLQVATAVLLLGFGAYKIVNYYRHPRWVGMHVGLRDLTWWSFLMATAHGAGLMIAPVVLALAAPAMSSPPMATAMAETGTAAAHTGHQLAAGAPLDIGVGVMLHTLSMLLVMALIALVVYKKVGLAILRRHWINFDLIWAAALLLVGTIALLGGFGIV